MEIEKVERLDHLGLLAGVIKDLKLIEKIDARISPEELEEVSTGEAIVGMILNGLGFSDAPMSLTPQFFENTPLELLIHQGVKAEHLNRFKLGRSLDKVFGYGCDVLFSEIALEVCQEEGVEMKHNHLDTTSFSLTGEYLPDSDEVAIEIKHGYSKDHRPDLKQAVLELMVSGDGGIPLVSRSWNGNESDNKIFGERAAALIEEFQRSETPRYVIADSKLYSETNAKFLAQIPFVTRIPGTLKLVLQVIKQVLKWNKWKKLSEGYWGQSVDLGHYGISQRWVVIYSQAAFNRAEKSLEKAVKKEKQQVEQHLFHLQAKRYSSQEAAEVALKACSQTWKYHQVSIHSVTSQVRYGRKGKPTATTPIKGVEWQIQATVEMLSDIVKEKQEQDACFVLATPLQPNNLDMQEILVAYKSQSVVERGFRFLKDPLFFVSSLFVKKPSRLQGLLMVMTLALMVYAIAERRLRRALAAQNETLPNQIRQPTSTPTLRWVFQMLRGINRVIVRVQNELQIVFTGITELRRKILLFFGESVCQLYQISLA